MSLHLTRAVLALDPGGSKCEAVLADENGAVHGWGRVQQTGLSGRSSEAAIAAAKQALDRTTFDELHIVSFGYFPKAVLELTANAQVRTWDITEENGALALMGHRFGVVVIAGTGDRIGAYTRDGRELTVDALGPLLGDYGSGYAIGREGLRAAARACMHPRHQTSMKLRLMGTFVEVMSDKIEAHRKWKPLPAWSTIQEGSSEEHALLWRAVSCSLAPQDRSAVASMAAIVNEEAEKGDAVAIRILEEAAVATSERVCDLLDQLKITNDEYPIVGIGSVAQKSDIYWNHLSQLIREMAPRFTPIRSAGPAALGNAAYVLRELSPEREERIRHELLSTPLPSPQTS